MGFFVGVNVVKNIDFVLNELDDRTTNGSYATENDAKNDLRLLLTNCSDFIVIEECPCWYYGSSAFTDRSNGRIDFALIPKISAVNSGWKNGVIGIECKKSGYPIGPLICQMMDYSRSLIKVSPSGIVMAISAVFAFPGFVCKGAIESIAVNNRIGRCRIKNGSLQGQIGESIIFSISDGKLEKTIGISSGAKNGSR